MWRSALQLHKQADMQEEKNRVERVLGAISAPDLIQKVLNFALSVCTSPFFGVVTHGGRFVFLSVPQQEMRG